MGRQIPAESLLSSTHPPGDDLRVDHGQHTVSAYCVLPLSDTLVLTIAFPSSYAHFPSLTDEEKNHREVQWFADHHTVHTVWACEAAAATNHHPYLMFTASRAADTPGAKAVPHCPLFVAVVSHFPQSCRDCSCHPLVIYHYCSAQPTRLPNRRDTKPGTPFPSLVTEALPVAVADLETDQCFLTKWPWAVCLPYDSAGLLCRTESYEAAMRYWLRPHPSEQRFPGPSLTTPTPDPTLTLPRPLVTPCPHSLLPDFSASVPLLFPPWSAEASKLEP